MGRKGSVPSVLPTFYRHAWGETWLQAIFATRGETFCLVLSA